VGPEGPAGEGETPEGILEKLLTVDGPGSGLDADTLDGLSAEELAALGGGGLPGVENTGIIRIRAIGDQAAAGRERFVEVNGVDTINFANGPGLALIVLDRATYDVVDAVNNVSVRRNFDVNADNGRTQWSSFLDALSQLNFEQHLVIVASKGPVNRYMNEPIDQGPTPAQALQTFGASFQMQTLGSDDAVAIIGFPNVGATNGFELVVDSSAPTQPDADLAGLLADGHLVGNESDDLFGNRRQSFPDSTTLNTRQMAKLNEWIGTPWQRWEICYRRSVHGIASTDAFFSRCAYRGPSVTVIKTANRLLGGYTEISWAKGNYGYRGHDKAFLFSFDENKRYFPSYNYTHTTYSHTNGFTRFGNGHDVDVRADGRLYCNFPYAYGSECNGMNHQAPSDLCSRTLCGNDRNQPSDVVDFEVWVLPRD
jgi:hypothetical protein